MFTKFAPQVKRSWCLLLTTLLLLAGLLLPFHTETAKSAPLADGIPPGHSDRILRLKFVEGTVTDDLTALLPAEAWQIIQKIDPLYKLPKIKLNELKDRGNERLKKEKGEATPDLPDLSQWYEIRLVQGTDAEVATALFSALPVVESIGAAPLETELPVTPDFSIPDPDLPNAGVSGLSIRRS